MASNGHKGPINYGQHMIDVLVQNITDGSVPVVVTDPNKLEEQAREKMDPVGYDFISNCAGEGATRDANRLAFRQWKLIPRVLRHTGPRDLSINLFGDKFDTPILMAPVGINAAMHPDKEIGVAKACAALRVPYTLSGAASTSYEELAQAVPTVTKWSQYYWPDDDDLAISLLTRAKDNGFKVLVYTVDSWTLGWRPHEMDSGYVAQVNKAGGACMLTDPVFVRKVEELAKESPNEDKENVAKAFWRRQLLPEFSRSWDSLQFLRKHWDGPIVLKGILSVEDAILAAHHGLDGIVVSNHGGRQVDGCVGSMDVLAEIVDAVGDKLTVMVDSGFRTGADIVKALALGAKAVFVGRPVVYGLGINGEEGAKTVLANLLAEVDITMGLVGADKVSDLSRSLVRKIQHPGDVISSL